MLRAEFSPQPAFNLNYTPQTEKKVSKFDILKNKGGAHWENTKPETKTTSEKDFPLSFYYPLDPERKKFEEFIQQGTSVEEAMMTVNDNLNTFLLEFAFKTPKTSINYLIKEDSNSQKKFFNAGAPVSSESLYSNYAEKVTRIPQEQLRKKSFNELLHLDREAAEMIAFEEIQHKLINGEAQSVFYISPPSQKEGFGDYLMIYYFEKKGDIVTNNIIRMKENKNLETSRGLYTHVKNILKQQNDLPDMNVNEKWYLMKPIYNVDHVPVTDMLKAIGMPQESLEKAAKYEEIMRNDELLQQLKYEYFLGIESVTTGRYKKTHQEKLLNAIFNRASELKRRADSKEYNDVDQAKDVAREYSLKQNVGDLIAFYSQKEARVVGGGSCPSTSTTANNAFAEKFGDHTQLNQTFESILENSKKETSYKCAKCGTSIPYETSDDKSTWRKECPNSSCRAPIKC